MCIRDSAGPALRIRRHLDVREQLRRILDFVDQHGSCLLYTSNQHGIRIYGNRSHLDLMPYFFGILIVCIKNFILNIYIMLRSNFFACIYVLIFIYSIFLYECLLYSNIDTSFFHRILGFNIYNISMAFTLLFFDQNTITNKHLSRNKLISFFYFC